MKGLIVSLGVVLTLGLVGTSAHALSLYPGLEVGGLTFTNSNCNAACVSGKIGLDVTELYKMEVDGLVETGSLAGSYTTTFQNSPTDPSGFTLTYGVGSTPLCPTCYLLVKDGNQTPYQYLFNLGSWNGEETITGTGFWPNQGAISHVAIYSTGTVPEPVSLLLLGAGLAGIGIWRRTSAKS